ncbi:MAG TPA: sugar ABC transporter permease [Anaerolineales bacterium]|nr:sugar ABC transporter permease [Anaerolineales bacterium]HRK89664.1 sugar ABC transporter permease [Anaerolineales bacterium]
MNRKVSRNQFKTRWLPILLFVGPVMLYYIGFMIYPFLATFYYSFNTIAPIKGELTVTFVGLKNYIDLLGDPIFIQSVKNTLIWSIVGPVMEILTALTLAFLIYFKVPLHRFYRTAWFTPLLVSGVIVGLVFRWIFNYEWGLLNVSLRAVGLDDWALNWLGRRDTPLMVVIFVHYWATFGYSMVLLLAGLSAVPEELLDAARVDGANRFQVILKIMIPILWPTMITVLVLSFIGKMRAFHIVWALTGGGPLHFTETVATYVQKRAFGWNTLDLGYPSAMSVLWFGVVMIGVGLINRWLKRQVEY